MQRILVSWSSGKDAAWTLARLRQAGTYEIVALVTTLNSEFDRVAMHGTRRALLEAQAEAAGLPLWTVPLPWPCSNEHYETAMRALCDRAVRERVDAMAFGDLFLQDVREYRERQLQGTGITSVFPLWQLPTDQLAHDMVAAGVRAKVVCVDTRILPAHFAGRDFDDTLLSELPADVDPCGENGEFHTCVYRGPMFRHDLPVRTGEVVLRDGFAFADLQLDPASQRD